MGNCPDWYMTLKAARYLQVSPWELMDRPKVWQTMALEAEAAELHAKREFQKRNQS